MNVAVAGLGFMGATHLAAWQQVAGARIAAVMSSDPLKLTGDLTTVGGNLGGAGQHFDFTGIRQYSSLGSLLADGDIDTVDICVPTDRHESAALAALNANKNVFLEKPMALDFAGAERLRETAARLGRVLMVGHVLRFIPAYRRAADWLRASGPLYSAAFRRRCAAPSWSTWLLDKSRSGGSGLDLLIHDADFCISVWGMPAEVRATGYENLAAGVDIFHAGLRYPGLGPVTISGGWHHTGDLPFSMDYTLVAEKGALEWSSLNAEAEAGDPFVDELTYFTQCVRDGAPPAFCPPEQSAHAVKLIRSMLESRERNGEPIRTV